MPNYESSTTFTLIQHTVCWLSVFCFNLKQPGSSTASVSSQIFMAAVQMVVVFWIFMPHSKCLFQCFKWPYCLLLEGDCGHNTGGCRSNWEEEICWLHQTSKKTLYWDCAVHNNNYFHLHSVFYFIQLAKLWLYWPLFLLAVVVLVCVLTSHLSYKRRNVSLECMCTARHER